MEYVTVTFMQVLFILVKYVQVRHIIGDSLSSRLSIAVIANVVWIIAISLGVKLMIQEDYFVILSYVLGTVIGVLIEHYLRKFI